MSGITLAYVGDFLVCFFIMLFSLLRSDFCAFCKMLQRSEFQLANLCGFHSQFPSIRHLE